MYAEAYNEYNKTPSEDVYDYVVEVRNRAKIKTRPYSEYASYTAFREFVRNERARELCFEAIRKYDLIRWGIFVGQLKKYAEWSQDIRWAATGNTAAQAARLATVQERAHRAARAFDRDRRESQSEAASSLVNSK